MNNEFKKIKKQNSTHYVLETASVGATSAGSVASAPTNLKMLKSRLEELKTKISVPVKQKPRNPVGMGSTQGRGTQKHKQNQRQAARDEKKIYELEKPSGSMFLKFRGKRLPGDEMMVLGYGGFGTTPKDVTVGNALIKPFPADDAYDVISKIEKIFKDQDFVGIEKIVLDIPNALSGQLRDVLNYAEQDPERFELYAGDDSEEPEAKTGGKVIGIGPDGKRIDRSPPKAQVGGSSRGVKQSKPDVTLSPKTPQAQTLLKQSGLPRTASGYKAPHALLQKLQSSLGQSKFDSMFNVGSMTEGDDQPDHEISMASSELQSIAADAANLLDIVKQRSEEEGLEAWQQSKITKAADFMNSVLQSIRGDEEQGVAEGERTMSRAAKGHEKYGKAGMAALAKAGRDGASDEKLDKIRNKYDKYDDKVDEEHNDTFDQKSHQYKTTMKHADRPTVQQRMAAHDIRPGIKGYRDRIDMLKDLERTGKLKDMEEGLRDPKDNPCWKGYKPVGTKKKSGRTVPNCVPVKEDEYSNKLLSLLKATIGK